MFLNKIMKLSGIRLGVTLSLLSLPLTQIAVAADDALNSQQYVLQNQSAQEQRVGKPVKVDRFADIQVLRYQVPGFDELTLQQKKLAYYLSQSALAGRDILWDQNYKFNLSIRRTLEQIYKHYQGDRTTQAFGQFETYLKRVWFSNGIHHHYSNDKIFPECDEAYLKELLLATDATFPLRSSETKPEFADRILAQIYCPDIAPKKVSLDASEDMVKASAVNFYDGLTQEEAEQWFEAQAQEDESRPVSTGLNSRLVKTQSGEIIEQVYSKNGLYGQAIAKVVYWLQKAVSVAETEIQAASLRKLIEYYETGDLKAFDEYNILWVQDTESVVDTINGFIETYNDPLGHTGSWESVVSIKDLDLTKKFGVISEHAGWFEEHSPIDPAHKRDKVVGVSYKVINVVMEAGDSSPASPIGINLPNANWIRAEFGSKSVSLGNIERAYDRASADGGRTQEFYQPEHQKLLKMYGGISDKLHTGLHEVIGHASGKILDGVGTPGETLKNYAATLEEARADLVALYYIGDQYLVDLGLSPSTDIMKATYISYITNGLMTQLARLEEGRDLEESHMRNRQMISQWVFERGQSESVIEKVELQGKTFFKINDYQRLRSLFGDLLKEVQRIKSEGDYQSGKNMVENYGVKVDPALHKEVKKRWAELNLAPYAGFINPRLTPVTGKDGKITDIQLTELSSFTAQMLDYAENHSFLPNEN